MSVNNKIAIVVIRPEGLPVARKLHQACPSWDLWAPQSAEPAGNEKGYDSRFKDWLKANFLKYDGFVCFMATGIVVRSVSSMIPDKRTGPGVVVCDEFGRQAIPLIGGHEGGANDLAIQVANILGAIPAITTGTEALKSYVLGVGCRKNAKYEDLKKLVLEILTGSEVPPEWVRAVSTIEEKKNEPCILELVKEFHWPLLIFSAQEINASLLNVSSSSFVEETLGVPGVCEPTALMASHYGKLIVPKTTRDGCALALVQEPLVAERRP